MSNENVTTIRVHKEIKRKLASLKDQYDCPTYEGLLILLMDKQKA